MVEKTLDRMYHGAFLTTCGYDFKYSTDQNGLYPILKRCYDNALLAIAAKPTGNQKERVCHAGKKIFPIP